MTNAIPPGPGQRDCLPLAADPRMVWVPLRDGQACGVAAHAWAVEDSRIRFWLLAGALAEPTQFQVASWDTSLLADEAVARPYLDACAADRGAGFDPRGVILTAAPGTKAIAGRADEWEIPAIDGTTIQVFATGRCLEGPTLACSILMRGWPTGSTPVSVDILRFPTALLTPGVEDWTTRAW
jgi:hypothetical protein